MDEKNRKWEREVVCPISNISYNYGGIPSSWDLDGEKSHSHVFSMICSICWQRSRVHRGRLITESS